MSSHVSAVRDPNRCSAVPQFAHRSDTTHSRLSRLVITRAAVKLMRSILTVVFRPLYRFATRQDIARNRDIA